jgi:hypothetical protein
MDTWKVDLKFLESFEVWFWRRLMKISWTEMKYYVESRTGVPHITIN